MSKRFLTPIQLAVLDSDPQNPSVGELYFNNSIKAIRQFNGTSWKTLPDSVAAGGETDWNLYWQPSW
jgi:hypothetical protein